MPLNSSGKGGLEIALHAVFIRKGYKYVIRISASYDGDSDSTASIAGQIYGAMLGPEEIPQDWMEILDAYEPVLEVTSRLSAHVV